ncbi:hypothetical protein D1007_30502 [Hordeum vulgare]|nr:hypothetical protein D1007_30502 [Hordeum vulgare]
MAYPINEVAAVGGAGDAASIVAGLVVAAANLEDKGVAGSDYAVSDLAGDKQVLDVLVVIELLILHEEEATGMKRKLAKTGFKRTHDPDYDDDDVYEYNSGDDVEDGNKESFIEKEAQKIG